MIINQSEIEGWQDDALRKLYWDGIVKLPWVWPSAAVAEYRGHMKSRPLYRGHVKAQGDGVARSWDDAVQFEVLSYEMKDAISAPHFFDFAIQFTPLVAALFGEKPLMYSCNAFWTRPGKDAPDVNIQEWHRDRDDRKFIALFFYGSDVTEEPHGPHLYAKGSHRTSDGKNRAPNPKEPVEAVFGQAGTAFFSIASGLHMGVKPRAGERLLAWARWGVSNPPTSYGWDQLKPVPAMYVASDGVDYRPYLESTRLVVDWAR